LRISLTDGQAIKRIW